ncbi:MAG: hypothetical protein ACLRWQ_13910 [Flavonifractor plautii]
MAETARLPVVVKPVASGSSIGVSIAHTTDGAAPVPQEDWPAAGRTRAGGVHQGPRDPGGACWTDQALPSIEIIPKQGFYDYANKYQPGAALEVCPAEIPPE